MQIKLFDFQVPHYGRIKDILTTKHGVIDMSPTGRGKTICALKVAQEFDIRVIVVAPANTLDNTWWPNIHKYGIKCVADYGCLSYEKLRGTSGGRNMFLDRSDYSDGKKTHTVYTPTPAYQHMIESGLLLIIDEAHAVKNENTLIHKAVYAMTRAILTSKSSKARFMILSATLFDKRAMIKSHLSVAGLISEDEGKMYTTDNGFINWSNNLIQYRRVCQTYDKEADDKAAKNTLDRIINDTKSINSAINDYLYETFINIIKPRYVSSMDLTEQATCVSAFYKLEEQYVASLHVAIQKLEQAAVSSDRRTGRGIIFGLSAIINEIEACKLPIFYRVARYYLDNYSTYKIIIYLNGTDNIDRLINAMSQYNPLKLNGKVAKKKRTENISAFQMPSTAHRLLIGSMDVGGVGVDLDDQTGGFPRIMLYSPNYKSIITHQSSGRIQRATTKGKGVFIMVFAAIAQMEQRLLTNLIGKAEVLSEIQVGNIKSLFPGHYQTFEEDKSPIDGKFTEVKVSSGRDSNDRGGNNDIPSTQSESKLLNSGISGLSLGTDGSRSMPQIQFSGQGGHLTLSDVKSMSFSNGRSGGSGSNNDINNQTQMFQMQQNQMQQNQMNSQPQFQLSQMNIQQQLQPQQQQLQPQQQQLQPQQQQLQPQQQQLQPQQQQLQPQQQQLQPQQQQLQPQQQQLQPQQQQLQPQQQQLQPQQQQLQPQQQQLQPQQQQLQPQQQQLQPQQQQLQPQQQQLQPQQQPNDQPGQMINVLEGLKQRLTKEELEDINYNSDGDNDGDNESDNDGEDDE